MSYKIKCIESKNNNDFILKYGHDTYRSYIFLNGLHVYFSTVDYTMSHWGKNDYYEFKDLNGVKVAEIPVKQLPENIQDKLDLIAKKEAKNATKKVSSEISNV